MYVSCNFVFDAVLLLYLVVNPLVFLQQDYNSEDQQNSRTDNVGKEKTTECVIVR